MALHEKVVQLVLLCCMAGTWAQAQLLSWPSSTNRHRSCTLHRTSVRGTCQSIYECPIVLRNVRKLKPTVCHFEGRVPFVCCPTLGTPSALTDVSPPAVSFTCGTSSVKPVTRNEVEAFVVRSLAAPDIRGSFPEVPLPHPEVPLPHPEVPLPHPEVPPPHLPDEPLFGTGGLIFAFNSTANTWPWMALLGYKGSLVPTWVCDGVLINQQWVLTAAHCAIKKLIEIVRLGEHITFQSIDSPHQDFEVIDTVFHPNYRYPAGYHDLALLKLDRPASFDFAVSPICLPWGRQPVPAPGSLLSLTGWGRTSFGGNRSEILQEATVYILDREKCTTGFSSLFDFANKYPRGITSDLLCIGDTDGEGQDACQGDSGGPVMFLNDDKYVLTGVVSVGYGCGNPDFPGLYASVHHAPDLAWIKRVAF